jgi:hypothetical protein
VLIAMTVPLCLDTVDRLNDLFRDHFPGIGAFAAMISAVEEGSTHKHAVDEAVSAGKTPVVVVMTPEMFVSSSRLRIWLINLLRSGRISSFVIDECDYPLSSTSSKFREDCRGLGASIDALELVAQRGVSSCLSSPPRCAMSGTIPRQQTAAVVADCGLRDPLTVKTSVERPNLSRASVCRTTLCYLRIRRVRLSKTLQLPKTIGWKVQLYSRTNITAFGLFCRSHVQIPLGRGQTFKLRLDELALRIVATNNESHVLVYAVRLTHVLAIASHLRSLLRLDGRIVYAVHGGKSITLEEKRRRLAMSRESPSVLVTNSAGARGLDNRKLLQVFKFAASSLIFGELIIHRLRRASPRRSRSTAVPRASPSSVGPRRSSTTEVHSSTPPK